jgi:hypothetical protein
MKRILTIVVVVLVIFMVLIQFIPYGRQHANPPVVQEPNWDNPQTRELAKRACFDCHSNETTWPWYSNVAPISWWVLGHVNDARVMLNFSEWQREQTVDEIPDIILSGEMPPAYYTLIHTRARLTPAEKETLTQGLIKTIGTAGGGD